MFLNMYPEYALEILCQVRAFEFMCVLCVNLSLLHSHMIVYAVMYAFDSIIVVVMVGRSCVCV